MPIIIHKEFIHAPIEKCFDLSRHVETIVRTAPDMKQKAVGGVTSGLLEVGDVVTWEAVHFGIRTRLSSQVIDLQRPYLFKDAMVKGPFHSFTHMHEFIEGRNGTLVIDHFDYTSPLSLLGVVADELFLKKYMQNFIAKRASVLKVIVESE